MSVDQGGVRISFLQGEKTVPLVRGSAPNHFRLAEEATSGSIHFLDIEPTILKEVEVRVGELNRKTANATYLLSPQAEAGSYPVPEGSPVRLDIYTLLPARRGRIDRRRDGVFILESLRGFFLTNEEDHAFAPGGSLVSRTNRGHRVPTRPTHGHL
jgi:hypothetical protein